MVKLELKTVFGSCRCPSAFRIGARSFPIDQSLAALILLS
jgi:hypothetical protein